MRCQEVNIIYLDIHYTRQMDLWIVIESNLHAFFVLT